MRRKAERAIREAQERLATLKAKSNEQVFDSEAIRGGNSLRAQSKRFISWRGLAPDLDK
jgi:hypothetical protein